MMGYLPLIPRNRRFDGSKKVMNRPRHHRLLPALALLTCNEETMSLILPGQRSLPTPGYHCPIQHCQDSHSHSCHGRRRKRSLFELNLHASSSHGDVNLMNSNIPSNCPILSPLFLQTRLQKGTHHQAADEHQRHPYVPSRLSTSLFMSQNSDSTGGFGKNNDRKKKKGDSENNSPKPKANKGIAKGAPSSPGNKNAKSSNSANNKTKRSRQRNNNKMNNKKRKNSRPKKSSNGKGNAKGNASSKHDGSTLHTSKSSINTNDQNTSLKGFKSEVPPASPQQIKDEKAEDVADDDSLVVSGEGDLQKRVVQLESIVSNQQVEIQKLRRDLEELNKAASVFSNVVDVLREAGLRIDEDEEIVVMDEEVENEQDAIGGGGNSASVKSPLEQQSIHDAMEIFGIAPKSVTDAADAAGASILSAILAGKHRMLVDVRDAELTRDPKLFVEFIELAILPVAAGLEGMDGDEYVRNRVKIVFPTVKELMSYRRSMALAAPEVVSLSTLGFDPVDERDNLIVVIAPSPDDVASVSAMEKLIARTDRSYVEPDQRITQPMVVLNHHMVPIDISKFGKFTSVYHLRLLSVQYMTGDAMPEYVAKERAEEKAKGGVIEGKSSKDDEKYPSQGGKQRSGEKEERLSDKGDEEDAALEAAMTHAHEVGVHQGVTRAMVIRAYPKPWHVFVDTSPDTDADFEVAATFDVEPTQEDVNYAIVECLEGSEKEDEIVAQQMQAALEAGQLNRVSDMLGISPSDIVAEEKGSSLEDNNDNDDDKPYREYDGNDWDDLYYDDWFSEDSV
mmetsp:Transcript_22190/g.46805  ORF Transcript_22190/g.46805 Transcript_22190/m.46805 type:complete len:790 (+) Transcript_22190:100-2469(+)|eukprot:CAMPEP_0183738926 /NCGR_PEP_ID=MMETSP0737-20130205/55784_1 /TAXON_ID=385413 /ORGANISM="Thalassiosira miniscula, Strain CCMP1093" /LENGTH=789 /DNA_ID=CAMNT_0025973581 /DNA_START=85 /DNA_END=2454 /DNA_ORIENTATION=-